MMDRRLPLLIAALAVAALLPHPAAAADCASCHQELLGGAHVHPPVAEGCNACHLEATGHPDGPGPALTAPIPGLCYGCHEPGPFQRSHAHGPAASGNCTLCHRPHSSQQPHLLPKPIQELCLDCHDDIRQGLAGAKVVHSAIRRQQCVACHLPHGSDNPFILKADQKDLCFDCHQDLATLAATGASRHAPLTSDKGCATCHRVHYAQHRGLLLEEEPQLCFGCHGGQPGPAARLGDIRREVEGRDILHAPLQEASCDGCHDPHASRYGKLLSGPYPDQFYADYQGSETYGFCFQCHDAALVEEAETTSATGFRDRDRNLHTLHVARTKKGRTCRACHEPHASGTPHLLNTTGAPFGEWRIPLRYLAKEDGGSCKPGCHRELDYHRHDDQGHAATDTDH